MAKHITNNRFSDAEGDRPARRTAARHQAGQFSWLRRRVFSNARKRGIFRPESRVDGTIAAGEGGFADGFREGGVGVAGEREVLRGGPEFHRHADLMDQVAR